MLGLGGLLFVCGILTHCMCTMTDRAAEQCNDIVPIEPVSFTYRLYTTVTFKFIRAYHLALKDRCTLKVDKSTY